MKLIEKVVVLLFSIIFCFLVIFIQNGNCGYLRRWKKYPDQWMEQKVDHIYNWTNETWQMRYFSTDKFFTPGGPMFIQIGGEAEINSNSFEIDYIRNLAKMNKAYLFYIEHRFYGESRPTADLSLSNLKFLSVRQVLADIANFITKIKSSNGNLKNSKVLLFGSSYGGSLVVWMKRKYPELVTGGWASSAPLLVKPDFPEYFSQIGKTILSVGGNDCYTNIKSGIAQLNDYFDNLQYDKAVIAMKLCNNFDSSNGFDLFSLFHIIALSFFRAQYNYALQICHEFSFVTDHVKALSKFISINSRYFENGCLNATYSSLIQKISNVNDFHSDRQFIYQQCSELGWFPTTNINEDFFGNKLSLFNFIVLCSDLTEKLPKDKIFTKSINLINEELSGLTPDVDNIFMTHGEFDPWRMLGMQTGKNVAIIPGASHCSDVSRFSRIRTRAFIDIRRNLTEFIKNLVSPRQIFTPQRNKNY